MTVHVLCTSTPILFLKDKHSVPTSTMYHLPCTSRVQHSMVFQVPTIVEPLYSRHPWDIKSVLIKGGLLNLEVVLYSVLCSMHSVLIN